MSCGTILLDSSTTALEIFLGGLVTAQQAFFAVEYLDSFNGEGHISGYTNNSTPVTMVAAPYHAPYNRLIQSLRVFNTDTGSLTITIQKRKGAVVTVLYSKPIDSGSTVVFEDCAGFDEVQPVPASMARLLAFMG